MFKKLLLIFGLGLILGCSNSGGGGDSANQKDTLDGTYFRINASMDGTYYQEVSFKSGKQYEMILAHLTPDQQKVTYIKEIGTFELEGQTVNLNISYFTCNPSSYNYSSQWSGDPKDMITLDTGDGNGIVLKSFKKYHVTGFDRSKVNAFNEDKACTFFSKLSSLEKSKYVFSMKKSTRLPANSTSTTETKL